MCDADTIRVLVDALHAVQPVFVKYAPGTSANLRIAEQISSALEYAMLGRYD